ncbi:MAG TPA: ABC transporter ATP-binding protein [Thermoanaerobaculia bacterium]|nr:ABC transporter ATP-binding protein [Thermoanaerobaculia bacterium]
MTDEATVRAAGLTRRFGELTAVDDLSFEVRRGELFGVVGPDGAGKTTTLRMLAGVLRPTAGDATIHGLSVSRDAERIKITTAYMPQRFGLYADLTVLENLNFYADLYRVPRGERQPRLARLFEFSGLGPFRDRLAGKLSGGMKQKLGLSCALVHQPALLLLDEPTFGVDPISRRELWLIIHEMVASGVTAVVSTSYLDEAERFDRLVFLHRGARIALDTPDALRGEFEGELVSARVPRARDAAAAARAVAGVRRAVVFGDRLHLTVESASRVADAIRSTLRGEGFEVGEVERIEPTLEDVFIERVGRADAP